MKKRMIVTAAGAIFCLLLNSQNGTEIPATFNGSSLQWTDYSDAPFGTIFTLSPNTFGLTYNVGARTMRLGGTDYNVGDPIKHPTGYVKAVDDMRANGFEPMVQVSFDMANMSAKGIAFQADIAAEVVRQLNLVHKRKVKYFIIANEPGKDQPNFYSSSTPSTVTHDHVRLIRDYVKKFSFEMKKIDPDIVIIAPGLEWHIPQVLDLLFASATTGTNSAFSVRGTIGNFEGNTNSALGNLFFVDILSFHEYMGFGDSFNNFSDVRKGTIEAEYDYQEAFQDVTDKYVACPTNTTENRYGSLKVAVDEYNFGAAGVPSSTTSTDISAVAKSANTFLAGQANIIMVASMLTAKEGTTNVTSYEFSNLWSAEESDAWGFIDNGVRKPTYWHYWLWANHFKGKFFPNKGSFPTPPSPDENIERGIKAYACEAGDYVAVLVMNMLQGASSNTVGSFNPAGSYPIEINFDGTVPTTANTSKIAFDMGKSGWSNNYTYNIDNETTTLLLFNCSGVFQGRHDLRRTNMTSGGGAASYTAIPYTGTPVTLPSISGSGTVCAGSGSQLTLTAPTGTVVQWRSLPDKSNLGTGSSLAAGVGFYELEMQGGCGNYFLTAQVKAVSPYISLAQTAGIAQYCAGSSAVLTASVGNPAACSWAPSTNLNTTTGTVVSANPSGPITYTASITEGGCTSSDQITVIPNAAVGLFVKDHNGDNASNEPNTTLPGSVVFWDSPNIWVTQTQSSAGPSSHTNAEYKAGGQPNYVYVRVENGATTIENGMLKLYWVKAGTGATWPSHWTNNIQSGVPYGGQIGAAVPVTVSPGGTVDVEFPWYPPNPSAYTVDMHHFCLLARVETGCGMTFSEGPNVWENTKNNAKVAWRNIEIRNDDPTNLPAYTPEGYLSNLRVLNSLNADIQVRFEVSALQNSSGMDFFMFGRSKMFMDPGLTSLWQSGGSLGSSVSYLGNNVVEFQVNNGDITDINLQGNQVFDVDMQFTFYGQPPSGSEFEVDVVQYNTTAAPEESMGGMRYRIIAPTCPTVAPVASSFTTCEFMCRDLEVQNPDPLIKYVWYPASTPSAATTGTSINVCPSITTVYHVDAIQNGCVITAVVNMSVIPYEYSGACNARLGGPATGVSDKSAEEQASLVLMPNPAFDRTIIRYAAGQSTTAFLIIKDATGRMLIEKKLDPSAETSHLDLSRLACGVYYVSLKTDNRIIGAVKLIVMEE